jgi:hypothetical protein
LNGESFIEHNAVREIARHDLAAACVNTVRYPHGFTRGRSINRILNVCCSCVPGNEWSDVTTAWRYEMVSRNARRPPAKRKAHR